LAFWASCAVALPPNVLPIRIAAERVADQNRGDALVGDRTARIALQDFVKSFFALLKPERVQHRHGTIELWLYFSVARSRKRNLTELLRRLLLGM
jgi:hypothetical protein